MPKKTCKEPLKPNSELIYCKDGEMERRRNFFNILTPNCFQAMFTYCYAKTNKQTTEEIPENRLVCEMIGQILVICNLKCCYFLLFENNELTFGYFVEGDSMGQVDAKEDF